MDYVKAEGVSLHPTARCVPVLSERIDTPHERRLLPPLRSNCDVEFALTVPERGVVPTRVIVIQRVGAVVSVRDERGAHLAAHGRLVDGNEEEVDTAFTSSAAHARLSGEPFDGREERLFVYPFVCAGAFDLVLDKEGFATKRVPITLRAGVLVPLLVSLRSSRPLLPPAELVLG